MHPHVNTYTASEVVIDRPAIVTVSAVSGTG